MDNTLYKVRAYMPFVSALHHTAPSDLTQVLRTTDSSRLIPFCYHWTLLPAIGHSSLVLLIIVQPPTMSILP